MLGHFSLNISKFIFQACFTDLSLGGSFWPARVCHSIVVVFWRKGVFLVACDGGSPLQRDGGYEGAKRRHKKEMQYSPRCHQRSNTHYLLPPCDVRAWPVCLLTSATNRLLLLFSGSRFSAEEKESDVSVAVLMCPSFDSGHECCSIPRLPEFRSASAPDYLSSARVSGTCGSGVNETGLYTDRRLYHVFDLLPSPGNKSTSNKQTLPGLDVFVHLSTFPPFRALAGVKAPSGWVPSVLNHRQDGGQNMRNVLWFLPERLCLRQRW